MGAGGDGEAGLHGGVMAQKSILEMAADVRDMYKHSREVCEKLKSAKADWTKYGIALDEALKISEDGLRNCWMVLDRIRWLAQDELDKSRQCSKP